MGEALEEVMGDADGFTERRRRDRLIIEILLWAQHGGYPADRANS
jgi:hypothetical protein